MQPTTGQLAMDFILNASNKRKGYVVVTRTKGTFHVKRDNFYEKRIDLDCTITAHGVYNKEYNTRIKFNPTLTYPSKELVLILDQLRESFKYAEVIVEEMATYVEVTFKQLEVGKLMFIIRLDKNDGKITLLNKHGERQITSGSKEILEQLNMQTARKHANKL